MSRSIPREAIERQLQAADPAASVFVSANAGSGKTHVLVQRVVRLLLEAVPPEKILCITFTKAAAANMAQRVFATLGHWVTLDDDALDDAIRATGKPATPAIRARARQLFASALDTPGGLKVQTIHALCTRLLQQFPFEADVPAGFAVLEERDQSAMLERANLAVLLKAAAEPESAVGRALAVAITSAADQTFQDVVRQACISRERFLDFVERSDGLAKARDELNRALGIVATDTCEAVEREIVDGPILPRSRWSDAAAMFETGAKTDAEQAARLRHALAATTLPEQIEHYLCVFCTGKGEMRKSFATKTVSAAFPEFVASLADEWTRLGPLLEKRRAISARDRTQALLAIAGEAAANYRREKNERGLLDYEDLIDKTLAMLTRIAPGWVHYKLDKGIDHVLIDEAQDTSPKQWEIIEQLIAEFAAGQGAREFRRTVFAVGDEKQSIFSFQGAVPREFDARRQSWERMFKAARQDFRSLKLNFSFRSGSTILRAVDDVFRKPDIYVSIHAENAAPVHQALPDAGPSVIDVWPLEEPDPRPEIEGWRAAFDAVSRTDPAVKLAARVQREIAALVRDRVTTGTKGERRPLRYGDMLVLVRRRGKIFDAVIQALKRANIPVAGADRLKLTEHIAVIDLLALSDAVLMPCDDLALATALKSPLFGLDDDDLFAIAWERKGSLRDALRAASADAPKLRDALRRLEACEAKAHQLAPFAFYSWVLGAFGGRRRMLARLGFEANDALDEFCELAFGYERRAAASLQGFVSWLRAAETEVKRDMEIARDEVRVMTVHGAKGLEAPVVFLVDTTSSPADSQRPALLAIPGGNGGPNARKVMVWAGNQGDDFEALARAREEQRRETEDEYRRLLYVAMTRAADRLIVAGCKPGNRTEVRKHSWYDLIAKRLADSDLPVTPLPPDGAAKRYGTPTELAPAESGSLPPGEGAALPPWLFERATPRPPALRVLRPSESSAAPPVASAAMLEARARARDRGVLVHRLMQSLPDLAQEARAEAAARYLARRAAGWDDAARTALALRCLDLIGDPQFAAVFASGSRAEVAIVGRLKAADGTERLVSGQIDRLAVTATGVLIVDYKTNQAPPKTAAEAPAAYVRQLALYRAVLQKLYPGRDVRAALLWTEAPDLMEISGDALDAELARALAG